MRIGSLIKKHRELLGLTQAELGYKTEMHGQFISNIERLTCLPPKLKISKLYTVLKIKRGIFMGLMKKEYADKLSGF